MAFTYFSTVSAYKTREKGGSMVVVIPKDFLDELGITKGTKFRVWKDKNNRLVYEPQKDIKSQSS
jgi:antitoxin component of MazEF toxin-antitoxin module